MVVDHGLQPSAGLAMDLLQAKQGGCEACFTHSESAYHEEVEAQEGRTVIHS